MIRRPPRSPLFPYTPLSRPPSVNLFKEAWHRRNHGRLNLQQRLRHLINGWNVRDGATLKNVDVIDDAPINMGKGQERKRDRKSTRLNSSHGYISYAVFCLKK